MMKCNRCGRGVSKENGYQYLNQILCEDCYIDARYPAKACDPWAVYMATRSKEIVGLKGTERLTDLQKAIYQYIKWTGRVSREQLIRHFKIGKEELKRQLQPLDIVN